MEIPSIQHHQFDMAFVNVPYTRIKKKEKKNKHERT